jgi:hypothetical protein
MAVMRSWVQTRLKVIGNLNTFKSSYSLKAFLKRNLIVLLFDRYYKQESQLLYGRPHTPHIPQVTDKLWSPFYIFFKKFATFATI